MAGCYFQGCGKGVISFAKKKAMEQEKFLVADFTEALTLQEIISLRNRLAPCQLRDELTQMINNIQGPVIEQINQLRAR